MSKNDKTPLVSICCLTYNHAQFIRKCLDGFLMQETSFSIEILIHDDCSTDGTVEILKEYEAKYPNLIFPLYETENKYQNGGAGKMDLYNYNRAKGKFIAYCEGDDYWTDPLKLQKQVDFMETHTDYSVCFTGYKNFNVLSNLFEHTPTDSLMETCCNQADGIDITPRLFFKEWVTMPLTMLFRRINFDYLWRYQYKYYRDSHEIYHLMKVGKCRLMNFDSAVRNKHDGGIASLKSERELINISLAVSKELYYVNKDIATKEYYIDILQWAISYTEKLSSKRFKLSWTQFCLCHNIVKLAKNLVR